MSSLGHPTAARNAKSQPCRLFNQGHCRFGDKCWFSHEVDAQSTQKYLDQPRRRPHPDSSGSTSTPSHDTSDARPRSKRGEIPCRAWKAGTCTKGTKCWFRHDNDNSGFDLPVGSHKQKLPNTPRSVPVLLQECHAVSPGDEHKLLEAERVRLEAEAAVARKRAEAISREEAAKTISQHVSGSIVTFSAGLDVTNLITGFETCTLRIGNLPFDVKEDDIYALLVAQDQGLDISRFNFAFKKRPDRKLEAHVVTDITSGQALALSLDGAEFQEEVVVVEVSGANSLEGMSATAGQSSEILTISWRAPSARYVAEYVDIAAARAKVRELDRSIHGGRRIKVEMNTQPPGRFVPNLRLNAIKINNLPVTVTNEDVMAFTGSLSVKRLPIGGLGIYGTPYSVQQIAREVRDDIELAVPGGLKKFDNPPDTCTMGGVVSARAHFSSWDDAHTAYTRLSGKRYGNNPIWLHLPDPMHFTLVIPAEQYKAQKSQWDSLLGSIKDRKACTLNVRDLGNVVRIQLSGSVKEATGALKVRVENLARGEKVEGWHRSLCFANNPFVLRAHTETGAFLRADWKRRSLKVYGTARAVDQAREMIKVELERLASLDYTITLARHCVGFFVREGLQQLKDTLGENNVRFAPSTRRITISGGEEARHALDRLITLSKANRVLSSVSQGGQTCPVCYDDVSSPHQLGCGHTYCIACLRHLISSALESDQLPLTCLGDDAQCRVPIAIPTVQQFLPPASFNRLLEAAFDAYIAKHPEEFKHCKTPDCTQIYRAVRAGATPQTLHCPSCFSAVCNRCHEDGHDSLSCDESKARGDPAEQERLNDAWIASQGGRVKKCPQCSVPIEKLEGCNHMTCRCGAHICWRCMGVFSRETIYPHMNTTHGNIYDNQPAIPQPPIDIGFAVDIDEQRELFRQVEANRAARNANAARPPWYQDPAVIWNHDPFGMQNGRLGVEEGVRLQRLREAEERERRVREQQRLLRHAEELDTQRRLRERGQLLLQEVEERRRAQERRQSRGWGCMIM